MKKHLGCADSGCGYYWQDADDDYPRCHFDGFGKAPCEEDDWDAETEDTDEEWDCSRCFHQYSGTADSFSCCACCECGEFYDPIRENED